MFNYNESISETSVTVSLCAMENSSDSTHQRNVTETILGAEPVRGINSIFSTTAQAEQPNNYSTTQSEILFGNAAWVACEAIHLSCIAVALYLLYALLHYRAIKSGQQKGTARHRKGGIWLENLCIIGIIAALLRFANNQVLVFKWYTSPSVCSILLNSSIAMYCVSMHPVYLFLWVRQRIFYSNRALKHLYSRTVRFLGWVALVCFIFTTILSMVLFVVDRQNSASGRVCGSFDSANISEHHVDENHPQGVKVNTMAGLLGGGIQLSFLALFLYPIMDNKLRTMRTKHMRSGSVALITLIRRSFMLAGLCILTDVIIALLVKTIHTSYPKAIFAPLAMYDLNLVINLLCIIVTFRRWRVMLFPWFFATCCHSLLLCNGSCSRLVRHHSTGKYQVSHVNRHVCAVLSLDTATQAEKSYTSKVYFERTRSSRRTKRGRPRSPVPDVVLPMLDESKGTEKWRTESLVTDHNQNIDAEIHQYSDTVLHMPYHGYQRKRSTSLILPTHVVPLYVTPLKRTKSNISASLLAKSKLWIMDHKGF